MRGKGQNISQQSYQSFSQALARDGLDTKKSIVASREAVDFRGEVRSGGESYITESPGIIHGLSIRVDENTFFVISHIAYSAKFYEDLYNGKLDFEADEKVFDLILSNLHFEE